MAPKSRKAKRASAKPKKTTGKADTQKKSAKKSKKAKRGGKAKVARSRSAYLIYISECRTEVLQRKGLQEGKVDFAEASRILGQAWNDLAGPEKTIFEALAAVDKHRVVLAGLSVRGRADAPAAAAALQSALASLGRAPAAAGPSGIATELLDAMEALDARMPFTLRAALGPLLNAGPDAATLGHVHRSFGRELSARLAAMLQRWYGRPLYAAARPVGASTSASSSAAVVCAPPSAGGGASTAAASSGGGASGTSGASGGGKKRSAPTGAAAGAAALAAGKAAPATDAPDDETRSKVVGLLMRTSAKAAGQANFATCRRIEDALFDLFGKEPKEYKRRARSLSFNLGANDGELLKRVLNGEVQPAELVRLNAEDLATDALKAERKEERERYFRSEVHDPAGPPKRRRDMIYAPSRLRSSDGLETQPDSQPDPKEEAEDEEGPGAAEEGAREEGSGGGDGGEVVVLGASAPPGALRAARASAAPSLGGGGRWEEVSSSEDEGSSSSEEGSSSSGSSSSSAGAARAAAGGGGAGPRTSPPPPPPLGAGARAGGAASADEDQLELAALEQLQEDLDMARALEAASPTPSSPSSPSASPAHGGAAAADASATRGGAAAAAVAAEAPSSSGSTSIGAGASGGAGASSGAAGASSAGGSSSSGGLDASIGGGADDDAELAQALAAASPSASSSSSSAPSSPSASPPPNPGPSEDFESGRAQLLAMGFAAADAEDALRRAGGRVQRAAAELCGSQPPPD